MNVSHSVDLDSHAVLVGNFDIPTANPAVWRWLLPHSSELEVNCHQVAAAQVPVDVQGEVTSALDRSDLSAAFQVWSRSAEDTLRRASSLDGGLPGRRFLGRASKPAPKKRVGDPPL